MQDRTRNLTMITRRYSLILKPQKLFPLGSDKTTGKNRALNSNCQLNNTTCDGDNTV